MTAGLLPLTAILLSCDSRPVSEKPTFDQAVGIWECSDFPASFLAKAGVESGEVTSRIEIRRDGSFQATNFPQRTPYRFREVISSSWEFTDPSMTPSGSWSIDFGSDFLQCRQKGGKLILRYIISGKDNYRADYTRLE